MQKTIITIITLWFVLLSAQNIKPIVHESKENQGRIITIKCGWVSSTNSNSSVPSLGSCEPPICPVGWDELITFNEVTAASGAASDDNTKNIAYGNTVRLCMEEEK